MKKISFPISYFNKSCLSLVGNSIFFKWGNYFLFLERNNLCVKEKQNVLYDNSNMYENSKYHCQEIMVDIRLKTFKMPNYPYNVLLITELELRQDGIIYSTPILKKQINKLDLFLNWKLHHYKGGSIKHVTFDLIRKQLQPDERLQEMDTFDTCL